MYIKIYQNHILQEYSLATMGGGSNFTKENILIIHDLRVFYYIVQLFCMIESSKLSIYDNLYDCGFIKNIKLCVNTISFSHKIDNSE